MLYILYTVYTSLHVVKLEPLEFIVHQGSQFLPCHSSIALTFPQVSELVSYMSAFINQDVIIILCCSELSLVQPRCHSCRPC